MFSKIKVWVVRCAKCEKIYATGDNTADYFHTKKEAIEVIQDDDWWHIRNGKAYCDECFIY